MVDEYKVTDQEIFSLTNLAEILDEDTVKTLGKDLLHLIEGDIESRKGWLSRMDAAMRLAVQVVEKKNTPWENASNVKVPVVTNACIQFQSRALTALVDSSQPVRCKVLGKDKSQSKLARAIRVQNYMSWQLLHDMEEWEDDMDRLLFVLAMLGVCYKKTHYSPHLKRIVSDIILPQDLIINYDAKNFYEARKTERIEVSKNEVFELKAEGLWLDVDVEFERPANDPNKERDNAKGLVQTQNVEDTPMYGYECHCLVDLDSDGYKEPYVVTMDNKGTIVRITPRFEEEDIITDDKGNLIKIEAENYFTQYIFIPDPHSSVSGIGYGVLLGPNNEAVNTMINQLIDASTKSVMGGGFIGRGARLKGGRLKLAMGQYTHVPVSGDDLRKNIVDAPVPKPDPTMFQLAVFLMNQAESTGSLTDMMQGQNPGQNQKVGTTMAVLEEGMKVYQSIHRRLHRAFSRELVQLYKLNRMFFNEQEYNALLDEVPSEEEIQQVIAQNGGNEQQLQMALEKRQAMLEAGEKDFAEEGLDIIPNSDPKSVSQSLQLIKSQSLLEKMMILGLNRQEVAKRVLAAEQHQDVEALMQPNPEPPSIEQLEYQLAVMKEMREGVTAYTNNIKTIAEAEAIEPGRQLEAYKATMDQINKQLDREQNEKTQQQAPVQPNNRGNGIS